MEDIKNDENNQQEDGAEAKGEEDVAESEQESQMLQEWETMVIDISVSCFSYLEQYQTQ